MGPKDSVLEEGALNSPHHRGVGFETGRNSFFKRAWLPPDREAVENPPIRI
jgi:hypothetical protein